MTNLNTTTTAPTSLSELRKKAGLSQEALSHKMGIVQSRVSRIERTNPESAELATLRTFVAALGGTLQVVAQIDGEQVVIA